MTGADDGQVPQLLPSVNNARVNAVLVDSLQALRAHTTQADLRERIDDVLVGRASLRDLAREESFAAVVGPVAERGWQQWEAMSDEDRDRLAADARERFDQD